MNATRRRTIARGKLYRGEIIFEFMLGACMWPTWCSAWRVDFLSASEARAFVDAHCALVESVGVVSCLPVYAGEM
jgi:hypothetical protein